MRVLKKILKATAIGVALAAAVATVWLFGAYPKGPVDHAFTGRAPFTFDDIPKGRALSADELDGYARRLLAEMSLQQKVLQMSGDTWLWDLVGPRMIGRAWRAGVDRRLRLPPIVSSDGPRGLGVGSSTCFPVPMARAASWDRALETRVGEAAGREARGHGVNLWLAPCLNLLRHPFWGRAQETYGEDPYLLGEMAAALVTGAQRHNVMACAKHYALNSIEETRMTVDVHVDERTLREVYLPHFRRAVDAGVASVMTAYNKVNGDYAAESRHLVREILKDEWGFRGFVVSDWFTGVYDGVKAANAGLDLEMPMVSVFGPKLQAAVEGGQVLPGVVDEAVLRLLRTRIDYATRPDAETYDASVIRAEAHVALAREAAEKGIVLARNENALLPLDRESLRTLAVVGPLADVGILGDHGSSRVFPPDAVTVVEGLRAALGDAKVVHEADAARAPEVAGAADAVVIVVGLDHTDESERIEIPLTDRSEWGGDRESLDLAPAQLDLVNAVAAANPRTIVVLVGGSAIAAEAWKDRVGAILLAFYPGEQGGTALARILLGDVNPSGKLPFTVARDVSELPPFDNRGASVAYGRYHGYTLADKEGNEPTFSFGFGRSYTTYGYANLALSSSAIPEDGALTASVDVTNTGRRAGDEIVQLYAGFSGTSIDRPRKLLVGFERVTIAAGETRRVSFTLAARDLAYWNDETDRWTVEPAGYQALVGPSSRAADLLAAPFRVVPPSVP